MNREASIAVLRSSFALLASVSPGNYRRHRVLRTQKTAVNASFACRPPGLVKTQVFFSQGAVGLGGASWSRT